MCCNRIQIVGRILIYPLISLLLTLTLCGKDVHLALDLSLTNFDTLLCEKGLDLTLDLSPSNFDTPLCGKDLTFDFYPSKVLSLYSFWILSS